jgi:hypothetical protein
MQNKTYNKLFRKASYLSAELEEHDDFFEKYKQEFLKEVGEQTKDKRPDLSLSGVVGNLEDNLNSNIPDTKKNKVTDSEVKILYKRIMKRIHPDKLGISYGPELKDEYSKSCFRANEAMNDSDLYILIDIALNLNIDVVDLSTKLIPGLEKCCLRYEKLIEGMKSTYAWIWANSDKSHKELVMSQYIEKYF